KKCLLQKPGEDQHGGAADKVVPKIADVRSEEEDEHKSLSQDGSKENGRAPHRRQEERDQKKSQDAAVENRSQNVAGLDEVLDQAGERRDRDSDETPRGRKPF